MRGLTTTAAVLAAASGAAAQNRTCASGLHIFVARGTTEPKGTGVSGLIADKIAAQVKGSVIEALDYPATFTDPVYNDSVRDGVEDLQSILNGYIDRCPNGKVAILGYSQGAHVAMDTICGGVGGGFDNATAFDVKKVENNIVAMVVYGDPTHRANVTYDKGTSIKDGIFQRSNESVETCTKYADRLISYCDTGDVYCDEGQNKTVHSTYIGKYGIDIVKFIVDRYNNATSSSGSGNSTTTATATTAAPTGSAGSATASGSSATATTKTAGASGLVASGSVYLAAPLALLAMLQAL